MCGIVGGISSQRDVSKILIEGLKRLEYRGYDSAGLAVVNDRGLLKRLRMLGKVQLLADAMQETAINGRIGIAHTRWATHGAPSLDNAHPHMSHDEIALVHNGIIENHEQLRQELREAGYVFTSQTDTEVAAHLIHQYYQQSENLLLAVQEAAKHMDGAFALGVIHQHRPKEMIAFRKGSPLVIGKGMDENFIASDPLALSNFANSVIFLQDGDCAHITETHITIYDKQRELVYREEQILNTVSHATSKEPYRHFMLKEIYEQTQVLADTLEGRISSHEVLKASFGERAHAIFPAVENIHLVACGTSYHACLVARYWLETITGLPTTVEIASEYRYRHVVVPKNTLFVTVSQSGETADTLAALYKAKENTAYIATLCICNVATSTLVRESDCAFLTRAGREIGVASTKAFTTQLAAFLMLATALCRQAETAQEILLQLESLPNVCEKVLQMDKSIEQLAAMFSNQSHAIFLGRGMHFPIALEGALKLKEISYIHAEGYPAGELKHGPLALVDHNMPVVAIGPADELFAKLKSNLHEVSARGGKLVVFLDAAQPWEWDEAAVFRVPSCGHYVAPIVYTIPLQLLAYYVAVQKGTDVDQPRNLAKSVTVE